MTERLRHLVAVCDHGSFTAAARHLGVSQPAVTTSIRRLEEAMGAELLVRSSSGARPTQAGRALLPWARRAIAAVEQGARAVADVRGLRAGEVRIGAGATAATFLLPSLFRAFRTSYPGVRILLRESASDEVRHGVRTGALDLGVVTGPGDDAWRTDALVLVRAPETDPADAPHISFPRGSPVRALLDAHFPEVDVVMELNSVTAIEAQVRAGIGVALVSEAAVADDLRAGRLCAVPDPRTPLLRLLSLVHAGEARLPPAAVALRALLLADVVPIGTPSG